MLRSRSNRQQRPSEPTDERSSSHGSSSSPSGSGPYNYGYGGAGGGGGTPMMAVASGGADDDDDYDGKATPRKRPSGGGGGGMLFGFGSGSRKSSSYLRNSSSGSGGGGGSSSSFHRQASGSSYGSSSSFKGHKSSGGRGGGSSFSILFAFLFVLILIAGGTTVHFKKANERLGRELAVAKRGAKGFHRFQHRGDIDNDNNDGDDDSNSNNNDQAEGVIQDEGTNDNNNNNNINKAAAMAKETARLNLELSNLQGMLSQKTHQAKLSESQMHGLLTQISDLEDHRIVDYESQLAETRASIDRVREEGREHKRKFEEAHRSGASGIVPGGPGQAVAQRREIEGMESMKDYENYVQRREDALWDRMDVLFEKLEDEARREAGEWFGPGPHRVELEIEYPQHTPEKPPSEWPRVRAVFQIEMAPLSLMPVAVNLFLQQVHHKLWNGCSFVINAMHILQAGPHRFNVAKEDGGKYDANVPELAGRFESERLDKMPYQEYHVEYPHAKYTLGFAGRPGGPDFYINKINNSVNHGPGGQSHHDLHEEADPCFARLVDGSERILDELNKIPTDYDKGALLLQPVVIVDSRVVVVNNDNNSNNNMGGGGGEGGEQQQEEEEEHHEEQHEEQQQQQAETAGESEGNYNSNNEIGEEVEIVPGTI